MRSHAWNKLMWGLTLITFGVMFLLDQIGLIEVNLGYIFSTYWPVILIYVGFMGFLAQSKYHFSSSLWNLMIGVVGVIFLLNNLKITGLSLADLFKFLGPVALILFGISIIFGSSGRRPRKDKNIHDHYDNGYKDVKPSAPLSQAEREVLKEIHGEFEAEKRQTAWNLSKGTSTPKESEPPKPHNNHKYKDFINIYNAEGVQHKSSFIGDVHLGQQPWELKPLVISHFIGDTVIDLTRAAIPLGETPINVSAFIGDVKIFVPNDVDVEVKVTASSFIGDMNILDQKETGMFRHLRTQTSYYDEADRKVIVTTSMFIGDVIVKKIG